ncbi:pseudaminic acid cytidylyltransferase [Desulfovibrio sp. UCD-KL4C]|uniref:pseudaminic acid cytidylyltransferase n=1 Tax=Desulfovibrio sp. UCD-KL4C TaxID=2578120 RepID=UPI0025BAE20E|nr:pseudaminic acid cytidylyltransferase [Desulfovibrio sp. UCD-KL4C]
MRVAIIPARGGSKRIANKNIKNFAGKPIISYPITTAIESGLFEKVIVSTDSEQIAETATKLGASVPFIRPHELADDFTPTAPVLAHAIEWLSNNGVAPEFACCIYATTPFIRTEDLTTGINNLLQNEEVLSTFSVTSFPFQIFRALKINSAGYLNMFWPEHETTRSQDLPDAYHDAGQFYWVRCRDFLLEPKLYTQKSKPVILPRHLVQDIDTQEDWETAELMYKLLNLHQEKC